MPDSGELRVEYADLGSLVRAPRNPKEHDVGLLRASLGRFGFVTPILLDDATGRIVAGHGRLDALQQLKATGGSPPERVRVEDGRWLVPVIRGVAFASPVEAESYLVADNQTTILGGWDEARLADLLADLAAQQALAGTGFDAADVDALLRDVAVANARGEAEPPAHIDQAAELQAKWETARGQLWEIGRHRVVCGDATREADVARVLDGATPRLMVTDPPYGVDYDPGWRNDAAAKGLIAFAASREGAPANDETVDWSAAWRLSPASVAYCWHADRHASATQASLEAAKYEVRCQIIWAKTRFAISRGHYHWQHEPCWYAVRAGASADWIGDRSQTTLWTVLLDPNVDGGHSTQKPLECMARPIRNHAGDVYDPFLGSGTTLVAAEQLGRRGYGLEIEPGYVAVILERLSAMGLTPRLSHG